MITVCCIVIKNEYTAPNCITLTLATAQQPFWPGWLFKRFQQIIRVWSTQSQTTKTINEIERWKSAKYVCNSFIETWYKQAVIASCRHSLTHSLSLSISFSFSLDRAAAQSLSLYNIISYSHLIFSLLQTHKTSLHCVCVCSCSCSNQNIIKYILFTCVAVSLFKAYHSCAFVGAAAQPYRRIHVVQAYCTEFSYV